MYGLYVTKVGIPQCKVVITSALINICNAVWYERNQARLNNKGINWRSSISVISNVGLTLNLFTVWTYIPILL